MKNKSVFWLLVLLMSLPIAHAFAQNDVQWHQADTVSFSVIAGQIQPDSGRNRLERLPQSMKEKVRNDVWHLSQQAAGTYIEFYTNSPTIQIQYQVTEELNMYHMSTTGVSGVDLYLKSKDGQWLWAPGKANFNNIISYNFESLDAKKGSRYRIYLPLYNHLKSFKIGVNAHASFAFVQQNKSLPIVVYGTSIAQGACASRAGMAWGNILGRKLDLDIVNLGFSGNGILETPLIDFMAQKEARMYVLDCMPNMSGNNFTSQMVFDSIVNAVQRLRKSHPKTPILLVEHSGGNDSVYNLNIQKNKEYLRISTILDSTFNYLIAQKTAALFILKSKDFNFDAESTVDGIHPNDHGMELMARAYENAIRSILHLIKGDVSTAMPITQFREYPGYDWINRHLEVLDFVKKEQPKLVILGNSIMHYWGGLPKAQQKPWSQNSWDQYIAKYHPVNMGFGWDRVENMLWRVQNGEIDGYKPDRFFIMAGTNNLPTSDSDEKIIAGIKAIIEEIKFRQPEARILLSGIFPRRDYEARVKRINVKIKALAAFEKIKFADFSSVFLQKNGVIDEHLFLDGLHPNEKGYEAFAKVLSTYLKPL